MIVPTLTVNTLSSLWCLFCSCISCCPLPLSDRRMILPLKRVTEENSETRRPLVFRKGWGKASCSATSTGHLLVSGFLVSCSPSLSCHQRRRRKCVTFFLSVNHRFLLPVRPPSSSMSYAWFIQSGFFCHADQNSGCIRKCSPKERGWTGGSSRYCRQEGKEWKMREHHTSDTWREGRRTGTHTKRLKKSQVKHNIDSIICIARYTAAKAGTMSQKVCDFFTVSWETLMPFAFCVVHPHLSVPKSTILHHPWCKKSRIRSLFLSITCK